MRTALCAVLLATACSQAPKSVDPPQPPAAPATQPSPAAEQPPAEEPPVDDGVARSDDGVLLLEGTPEIPEALREQVGRYLDVRSASLVDIADDGKSILIGTRFGETSQIHRVASPMAARTQVTFRDEPVSTAFILPGGDAILYGADRGGDEKQQLYRLDLGTRQTVRLTDGTSRNLGPVPSWDGKRVAFYSNARNGVDFDVWISDGADPAASKLLVEGKGYWYPLAWSRDGKKLLVGEYVSVTESRVYVADTATGAVTRLSPESPPAAYSDAVFSRDGKTVYLTSDREGEFRRLWSTDLAGSKWTPLSKSIPWDVVGLAMAPSGRQLAFATNEGGVNRVHLLDTRTRRHKPIKELPSGLIGGLRFAGKTDIVGMTISSSTEPGDAYTYDLRRRKLTRWTRSELGDLDRSAMVEPTLIEFSSFDQVKIPAFYYRPKGDGPFPVVVNIHGGPESQSRPWFSAFTQYMISRGIAVIYPNVRGSTGYGKTYTTLDNGMKREDSVKDIGALLDWIGQQKELDAKRVGVIGGSYGGYMVLASLVHYSDRIVAGVDVVGISNFVTFLENTGDYRRDLRRVEYGDERDPAMRAHLQKISPLTNVDEIDSALFVAQGANDPRVPASEAEQIVKAVRSKGKDVWYMLARNEGHGFAKKSNRDTYLLLSILFLESHLK